ncbi:hypothetical protein Patl1_02688 [Pistacia atlantica]|uniref:Uncharacterized protein n=1 Tax=Pistacia atlantica TaxID=434234 RepID=A0ACC1C882_9ROSI|nr:hypothetical protein Patl1_02688 [Pistacia atlantica]
MVSSPSVPLTQPQPLHSSNSNWAIGGLILTAEYIFVPLWYIVQTQIMEEYPAELTVDFFYNLCGLFGSCMNNTVHTWALRLKEPVFIAMFKLLSIAIAVAMSVMFLGDILYLGSLIGATIISIGFYTVMWGKAKEEIGEDSEGCSLESPDAAQKVPLLQNNKNDLVQCRANKCK